MSNPPRQVIAMGSGIGLGGGLGLVLFNLLGWAVALGLVAGAAVGGVIGLVFARPSACPPAGEERHR